MEKCPFCGAKKSGPYTLEFRCGTIGINHFSQITWSLSEYCYRQQIATRAEQIASLQLSLKSLQEHHEAQVKDLRGTVEQQAELIQEAVEVVRAVSAYEPKHDGFSCHFCEAGFFTIPHQPSCVKLKAQSILPKLEEAIKEKP